MDMSSRYCSKAALLQIWHACASYSKDKIHDAYLNLRKYVACSTRLYLSSDPAYHSCLPSIHHLLEDLTISPGVLFSIHQDRLIPAPLVFNEGAILVFGRVQFCEFIAFKVGRHVESRGGFLAPDQKGATHDGVVTLAINRSRTEDVFAGGLEAREESTCQTLGLRNVL